MWFHCDTTSFGIESVGVLTAPNITGPWTFASPCFQVGVCVCVRAFSNAQCAHNYE